MQIQVTRTETTEKSTIGRLIIVNQEFQCWTLEPPILPPPTKPRAIPAGSYPMIKRWSNIHQQWVPGIDNVPDFSNIEIHSGSFGFEHLLHGRLVGPDTKGCLLVGLSHPQPDFIGGSHLACSQLYSLIFQAIESGEPVFISILDPAVSKADEINQKAAI